MVKKGLEPDDGSRAETLSPQSSNLRITTGTNSVKYWDEYPEGGYTLSELHNQTQPRLREGLLGERRQNTQCREKEGSL